MGVGERGGGFQTYIEVRGLPELMTLPAVAHPEAPLLRDAAEHGVLIVLLQGMDDKEQEAALRYGTHAYALKDTEFIHTELDYQVQVGHVAISPLEEVKSLQNLWLSPVALITEVGRRPCLFFDFTWIWLNKATKRVSPMEAIRFGGTLQRILRQVLMSDTQLGTV